MKTCKFFILTAFAVLMAVLSLSASAAENYFRPGTVWTIKNYRFIDDYITYSTILDEIEFQGEKVLPFASYRDENPEPKIERYLRTDGDKVYWRSTNPEYPNWYLLYDFGLKIGDTVVVYDLQQTNDEDDNNIEVAIPATLLCLDRDYYFDDNPMKGPLMKMQLLSRRGDVYTNRDNSQGYWITGMGYFGGPGSILDPHFWGWDGGGSATRCVESPKGNVVFGEPVAGIKNGKKVAVAR